MTKIYYYTSPSGENPISKFLDSLPEKQQAKILRVFNHIKQHSLVKPIPNIKKLTGTPLWEIRILGRNNIRLVYAVVFLGHVLILHGFIKKKNKASLKDISLSLKRFRIWKEVYSNAT